MSGPPSGERRWRPAETFFPVGVTGSALDVVERARAVCARCTGSFGMPGLGAAQLALLALGGKLSRAFPAHPEGGEW